MSNKDVLKLIKDEDVAYVDIRFTDPRGKMQHVTVVADLVDEDSFRSGFIGLQVHQVPQGSGPYEVRWRNLFRRRLDEE